MRMFFTIDSIDERKRRIIGIFLCLSTALVLWQMSCGNLQRAEKQYGNLMQIRMEQGAVEANQIDKLAEGKEPEERYTAWTQLQGAVENKELGRSVKLDVIFYYGDNSGSFDLVLENGCALPYETVFALWGHGDTAGQTIWIDEKKYLLEKILGEGTVGIVRVDGDTDKGFSVVDIHGAGGSWLNSSIEETMLWENFSGAVTVDVGQRLSAADKAGSLPVWIFAAALSVGFLRKSYRHKNKIFLAVTYGVAAVLVLWICGLFFSFPLAIAESFLPTRWSDFSFFEQAFSQARAQQTAIQTMEKLAPDLWAAKAMKEIFIQRFCGTICLSMGLYQVLRLWQGSGATREIILEKFILKRKEVCSQLRRRSR